jgi:hypothetical protein
MRGATRSPLPVGQQLHWRQQPPVVFRLCRAADLDLPLLRCLEWCAIHVAAVFGGPFVPSSRASFEYFREFLHAQLLNSDSRGHVIHAGQDKLEFAALGRERAVH